MGLKALRNTDKMKLIHELKRMGIAQSDIEEACLNRGIKPPSKPTIRKYYNMEESVSITAMSCAYAKEHAFDEPHCRELIIRTINVNDNKVPVSSIHDLLQEKLVETNILEQLPGNEQTLRNYCKYLKAEGLISAAEKAERVYDDVPTPEPGEQMQLDYGVTKIRKNEEFHFIGLLLRHSRLMYVKAQDHCFNGKETCNAINGFFTLIGGRVKELVIDQDACLVVDENYGEIITTLAFTDFLKEQDLNLFVCRKADPETKGASESTIKFVKQNYLPSRMDWALQDLINGVSGWCTRKNSRIHGNELWKIDDHFLKYEKSALQPLVISQHDSLVASKTKISVSNTRRARYLTNKYVLPRDYKKNDAWYLTTATTIMFYENEQDLSPVCSYALPSPLVKHDTFEDPKFKKPVSRAYREIYDRILKNWHAKEMKHYLNGLHKEHENSRYLRDVFKGFEKMLKDRNPGRQELEEIMAVACSGYEYQLSQLTTVWDLYLQEQALISETAPAASLAEKISNRYPDYVQSVEKRSTTDYSQIVNFKKEDE